VRQPKEKAVIPIKSYPPQIPLPRVRALPTSDEQIRRLQAKVTELEYSLELAKDRVRRYREVVESEVKFWERGLLEGEWEGYEATRRRLSRLKGALAYLGVRAWGKNEEL
jgi:hypothetical protein